jgi:hypothetical protein
MLYFMGGPYLFAGDTATTPTSQLYAIPLNQTLNTTSILAAANYFLLSVEGYGAVEPDEGGFFVDPDETILYSFAGFYASSDQSIATSQLLAFDIKNETWSNVPVLGGALNFGSRIGAMSTHSEGLSFFSSGLPPDTGWIPGMIRFNGSISNQLRWTNETSNNPPNTLAGSFEFIRYGKEGSIISFGGLDQDEAGNDPFGLTFNNFSHVSVYDIASATWFTVTAGGTIPPSRFAHCTAVSTAPDASSVQVTISGGTNGEFDFADIWVLTIPSFTWIDVTDTSSIEYSLSPGQHVGRNAHKCKVVNGRTMLSLGGFLVFNTDRVNTQGCNASWPMVRALDTSTYKWLTEYTPDVGDYFVPDVVVQVIGGNGKGGATATAPSMGFTNQALVDLFAQTVTPNSPTATAGIASSTTTGSFSSASSAIPSPSPGLSHVGAIAGGAAGGGVALILTAIVTYFCLRRHRQNKPPIEPPVINSPYEIHGAHFSFDKDGKPLRQPELESRPPPVEADGDWLGHQLDTNGTREVARRQDERRQDGRRQDGRQQDPRSELPG